MHSKQRMIIQIDFPGEQIDMRKIGHLLSGTGVDLDEHFGVVPVDAASGRYVVRGSGDQQAKEALRAIEGIQIFPDQRITPA